MKNIKSSARLAAALALAPLAMVPLQSQAAVFGLNLTAFSILSAEAAVTTGANAYSELKTGSATAITIADGSTSGGDIWGTSYTNNFVSNPTPVANQQNLALIATAKGELESAISQVTAKPQSVGPQFSLLGEIVGMGVNGGTHTKLVLLPGVYNGAGLTTGADSDLVFDGNGQTNPLWVFNITTMTTGARSLMTFQNVVGMAAGVIWNSTSITTGAASEFIGTSLSTAAYVDGAGASMPCGSIYALHAAVTTAASSHMQTTNCMGSATWAVSQPGGIDASPVPEPETYALLLAGLGVLGFKVRRNKQSQA